MSTPEFLHRLPAQFAPPQERGRALGDRMRARASAQSFKVSLLWMGADVITVLIALALAIRGYLGQFFGQQSVLLSDRMFTSERTMSCLYLLWFIVALLLVSRRMHLYGPIQLRNTLHDMRLTIQACMTAGLLLAGSLYFSRGEVVSRGVVLVMLSITTVLLCLRRLAWRAVVNRRHKNGIETRNVLVVGTGRVAQALRHHIESVRHLGYTFKGYVYVPGADADAPGASPEVLGDISEVFHLARKHFVDEIFLSTPCERGLVKATVEQARAAGVDIRVVPDLYDGLAWNSPIEYIGQFPTIPLHRGEVPVFGMMMKRLMDVLISSVVLVVLSPLIMAIALAIAVDSPGGVFYTSERIGKKGRVFRCVKFRTMVKDAERRRAEVLHMNERDSVLFKISNDPRVTRLGRLLRKYSIDELPQLLNVLRGDMSLVGPRPPIASEVKRYELNHLRRLNVTPGITGLWQVQARQDPSFDSYISLDTAYIENWSLLLDIKILVRTIGVVLAGTGA